ncbi:type II toxin-antitoxin system RelE/ParE family toxin [Marinobacter gelidimuriae]|uniref:type II toxin-antitoxin system RelE/ParE family toxin n=1 Tax=Marinobacter gelidimuriae TaxID=2739064 RepID=UPI0009DA9C3C|nr:type II toxin-antitoxin system RelE/ParE family toxin [Marinobacter gelidimuriae]
MLDIEFHPDVTKEIKSSYQWYQNQTDGLGQDYLSELESSFQTVRELPNTWPKFQKGFRRFLLSKFPFSVIYQSNENTVFVVAVMHNSRQPGYWNDRS